MQKNLIIILVLAIFISIFAILNAGAAPINLFFTTLEVSIALVILISATIGAVIVFSLDTASKYRYQKKVRETQRQNEKLRIENDELKEKNEWYESELSRFREQHHEGTPEPAEDSRPYRWEDDKKAQQEDQQSPRTDEQETTDQDKKSPFPFTDPWSKKNTKK